MQVLQVIYILLAMVIFAAVLIWAVEKDFKKWVAGKAVDHNKGWLIRAALLSPTIILLIAAQPLQGFWHTLFVIIDSCAVVAFLWWFLFDGLYNNRRDYNWWFIGSFNDAGHPDAKSDEFLNRFELWQQILIKVFMIIASTGIYILLFIK